MDFNLDLKAKINVTIKVIDAETKEVLQKIEDHNIVTTLGKSLICDLLAITAGVTGLNYFAVGTNNTSEVVSDTKLNTEVFRDLITKMTVNSNVLNVQYYLDSTDGNGSTLKEAGLFGDNASGTADSGTIFARVTHSNIVKTSSIAVTYSWDITIN